MFSASEESTLVKVLSKRRFHLLKRPPADFPKPLVRCKAKPPREERARSAVLSELMHFLAKRGKFPLGELGLSFLSQRAQPAQRSPGAAPSRARPAAWG